MTQETVTVPGTERYEHLVSPFHLRHFTLRNRVVWLPHLTGYADLDGLPSERHAHYYAERARGGVSLIISGCETTHPAAFWPGRINAFDRASIEGYRRISGAVHEYGAYMVGQLTDDGNQGTGDASLDWHYTHGASRIADQLVGVLPKEMDSADIHSALTGFGVSAETHIEGNFDGVELKVAHDGLLRQFLSPLFNHRTDDYGGSVENRLRFLKETVDEIRRRIGPEPLLGLRLCLDEGLRGGLGADLGVEYAGLIGTWGSVDYINTDLGSTGNLPMMNPDMAIEQGYAIEVGSRAKAASGLPTIAFGRIKQPAMAEQILADGKADLVGMARPLITDPEWVNKVLRGEEDDIRNCIACNQGCVNRLWAGLPITCILNPAAGREKKWGTGTLVPASNSKRVVIIGAGPAGLKVAEVSARRGHEVVLIERSSEIGGNLSLIRKLQTRSEWADSIEWFARQLDKLDVDIRLNTEVGDASVRRVDDGIAVDLGDEVLMADEIVVTTGGRSVKPKLEAGGLQLRTIREAMRDPSGIEGDVIVWDEEYGRQPCTVAEFLARQGLQVTFVTPADHPAGLIGLASQPKQLELLYEVGVRIVNHTTLTSLAGPVVGRNVYTGAETTFGGIGSVVHAIGWEPNEDLYLQLRRRGVEALRAGDCVAPRDVGMAIYSAETIAREL
jgi:2,4-dienoyl-CoA reductase-like NADH-dependent reductase (Old Yellow Enzyme family)/thioredoxin reductase